MADEGIDKLAKRLAETLPQNLRSIRDDLEKNFRAVLQSSLGRLDLVTREEFEVQQAVLARTREKLEMLEARLKEMESGNVARKTAGTKKKKTTTRKKTKTKKKKKKKSAKKKARR